MQQEQDYMMRVIHQLIEVLLGDILRGKESISEEQNQRYNELKKMVDSYQVNQAENELFSQIQTNNPEDMALALMFYQYVNEKDDAFLEKSNYTREEIEQGIQDVAKKYGQENITELFFR